MHGSEDSWEATGKLLDKSFQIPYMNLYQIYGPVELDYTIPFEEKKKMMEKWYKSVMNLYYEHKLTKEKLKKSVEKSQLIYRNGAKEFLTYLYENNIPVIILSAGIGNTIEEFLRNTNTYFNNIHIISNFIKFDENGDMKVFDSEIIHALNKTMNGHLTKEISDKLSNRRYTLLIGDLIEDKNMVDINRWKETISVGFLEKNVEQNLEKFKENFDLLLTNEDTSFTKIREILL